MEGTFTETGSKEVCAGALGGRWLTSHGVGKHYEVVEQVHIWCGLWFHNHIPCENFTKIQPYNPFLFLCGGVCVNVTRIVHVSQPTYGSQRITSGVNVCLPPCLRPVSYLMLWRGQLVGELRGIAGFVSRLVVGMLGSRQPVLCEFWDPDRFSCLYTLSHLLSYLPS